MQLKELCAATGLTRKAVEYYQKQGLVHPAVLPNGYRNYSTKDADTLREVALLRRCGMPVEQIRTMLAGQDKTAALERHLTALEKQQAQLQNAINCTRRLIQGFAIDVAEGMLAQSGGTVLQQLEDAFPGGYGRYLSVHFGAYLCEVADTPEKQAAYNAILAWLDTVPDFITPELEAQLEKQLAIVTPQLAAMVLEESEKIFDNYDEYLAKNADFLKEYIRLRKSDAWKNSDEAKMAAGMRAFQKASGYEEIFLHNLCILSPAYNARRQKMQACNAKLLAAFPEAAGLEDLGSV